MKTGVFKKAGYFAAAFALAASGSIFVSTASYAESHVVTQDSVDEQSDVLVVPGPEGACMGEPMVLGEDITTTDAVVDFTECEYGADNVTLDLNGHTWTITSAQEGLKLDEYDSLTIEATGGGAIINRNGPIFSLADTSELTVKGGVYNKEISTDYLADGYAEYEVVEQGVWAVDVDTDLPDEIGNDIFLKVGETVDLADGLSELAKKYFDYEVMMAFDEEEDWRDYLELNGTKITGLKSGELIVDVTLHKVGGYTVDVGVFVYDENDDSAKVHVELNTEARTEEELANDFATEVEELKEAIGDDKIAGYYDIKAQLVSDDFGWPLEENLGETDVDQTITVAIPSDVPVVADGYTRAWYFVYHHNGEVKRIEATDNGDGTVTAYSKEFSPYILAYVDTTITTNGETTTETVTSGEVVVDSATATVAKITNPNTLDKGLSYVVVAALAGTMMVGAIVYLVKREA